MRIKEWIGNYSILICVLLSISFQLRSQKVYHKVLDGQRLFNGRNSSDITPAYNNDGYVVLTKKGHWSTGYKVHLICYDACEQLKWEKEYDLIESSGLGVVQDGYVLHGVGYTKQGISSYASVLILRLDTLGNVLTSFTLEDISVTSPKTLDIRQTGAFEDGSYYLSGQSFDAPQPANYQYVVVKFDKNDNVLWSKYYTSNDNRTQNYYKSIPTKDGGILIYSLASNSSAYTYGYLMKIGSNGEVEWSKKSAGFFGHLTKPIEVEDGYIIAANNESNHPDGKCFLVKIDFDGKFLWKSEAFGLEYRRFTMSHLPYSNKIMVFGIERSENYSHLNSYAIAAEFSEDGQLIKKAEFKNTNQGYLIALNAISLFDYYFVLAAPIKDTLNEFSMHIWKGRGMDDLINCGFVEVTGTYGSVSFKLENAPVNSESFNSLKNFAVINSRNSSLNVVTQCEEEAPLPPMVKLPNDTTICKGSRFILKNKYDLPKYNWSTGEKQPAIRIIDSGRYVLNMNFGCIKMSDTIKVHYFPQPLFDFDVFPTEGSTSDTIEFLSLSENVQRLTWNIVGLGMFEDSTLEYVFEQDSLYMIVYTVIDQNGCVRSDHTYVTIKTPEIPVDLTYDQVFIPNSFTPDGNNVNDEFYPQGALIYGYRIEIFNRWGEHIYDEYDKAWNGSNAPFGPYLYKLTIQLKTGDVLDESGVVYLVK